MAFEISLEFDRFAMEAKLARITSDFNEMTRQVLRHGAQYWIRNMLPLHFLPSAVQRYGYRPRSRRTRRIKEIAKKTGKIIRPAAVGRNSRGGARTIRSRDLVPVPPPPFPSPNVWTGEMRREVLNRPVSAYNLKPVATSTAQRVTIPVRVPHPIHPTHKGEIVRLNNRDRAELRAVMLKDMRLRMQILRARNGLAGPLTPAA